MTRNEYLKQLTEGQLLPAYLFLGEERLFHEELFRQTLHTILPEGEEDFNLTKFNAEELDGAELFNQLETPPFFGDTRMVRVVGLENAKNGADEAVLKGIRHLADGVHLFVSATKLDGRKKIHQQLQKSLQVVDCNRININELPIWVGKRAQKMGLKLTPAQTSTIAHRVGTDLLRIRTELEKIKTYTGKEGILNNEALNELLPLEPEPNIFGLIDAVAASNPKQGIPRLQELLDAGEPELKILATLSKQFRNIAAALEGKKAGLNPRLLASHLGINPYVAEKSMSQAAAFSLKDLHRIINRLLWADFRMKTGGREPRLELELAIVEICGMNSVDGGLNASY